MKEKFVLFLYFDAIARIIGWFLHLARAVRVGSSIFSAKESKFLYFEILIMFTAFAKKLFGPFANSSQFFNDKWFSFLMRFILPKR